MAKRLTMAEINTILTLHKAGYSNREIAALLGVNRETIGKHLARAKPPNQPKVATGNATNDPKGWAAEGNSGMDSNGTSWVVSEGAFRTLQCSFRLCNEVGRILPCP